MWRCNCQPNREDEEDQEEEEDAEEEEDGEEGGDGFGDSSRFNLQDIDLDSAASVVRGVQRLCRALARHSAAQQQFPEVCIGMRSQRRTKRMRQFVVRAERKEVWAGLPTEPEDDADQAGVLIDGGVCTPLRTLVKDAELTVAKKDPYVLFKSEVGPPSRWRVVQTWWLRLENNAGFVMEDGLESSRMLALTGRWNYHLLPATLILTPYLLCVCVCVSACLRVCVSACLRVCLSVCLSVCL
eukprot:COSAG03_NODE_642_length_6535_cov_21.663611_9_plen_241_part_00